VSSLGLGNISSYKRPGGLCDVRGSSTVLPQHPSLVCSAKLSLRIAKYGQQDGFIHLVTGFGDSSHVHHSRPNDGDLPALKRHTTEDTQRLIKDGHLASTGSSALRYLVLKNKNVFVQKTTMRSIQLAPDFLTAGAPSRSGQSTASRLVNWLRVKAQDKDVGLRYTALFHRVLGGDQYHSHPKGRPPASRMSLDRVNDSLHVQLGDGGPRTSCTSEATKDPSPHPSSDFLEPLQLSWTGAEESFVPSTLPIDGIYGKDVLTEEATNHRNLLKEFGVGTTRIMLGAAWVDQEAWREFCRYPECLFVDTTHGTNNESRPLLLLVGRDSNSKAFTICRIFMPNETAAFYRWVFLEALPLLLGEENLGRVKLIVSDGDSQEFNAIDEGIFHVFKGARRGRCAYHVVQKTWETDFPSQTSFLLPDQADPLTTAIKRWVYTWMDGSSCHSPEQFEFSRDLLFHTLESNEDVLCILGTEGSQQIRYWLNKKVLALEEFLVFHPKRFIRCFEDYMNNLVEGMNYAAKKSDISAKPKDNMDTAAEAMLNYASLKNKTRHCELARGLMAVPLYVQPGYGHNVPALGRLRKAAAHMIIQQFRGKHPCLDFCLRTSQN
jgi:hypothetical protein